MQPTTEANKSADEREFNIIYPAPATNRTSYVGETEDDTIDAMFRKAWKWIAKQFYRVVTDNERGSTVDYREATEPPPNHIACGLLESWAQRPPDKRDSMVVRMEKATKRQPAIPKELKQKKPKRTDKKLLEEARLHAKRLMEDDTPKREGEGND
jgi:hypothetical protein